MEDQKTTNATARPGATTISQTRSTKRKILSGFKKPRSNKSIHRKMLLHDIINKERRIVKRLEYQINQSRSQTSKQDVMTLLNEKLRLILPRQLLSLITKIRESSTNEKRGSRFSSELKSLCLSLWQRSPAVYRLLAQFTHLPTIQTLRKIHQKIPAMIGLNETFLRTLALAIRRKPKTFKTCVLLFDEILLTKGLHYKDVDDSITGFEDYGQTRTLKFADRAVVFMARGITANWKQPITYYLSHGPVPPATLKRLIVDVVKSLQEHFFTVTAVVCGHEENNRAALNALMPQHASNRDPPIIQVKGKNIVTLWDAPRLLSATCDNLKKANVKFIDGRGGERVGQWSLFKLVYDTLKNDSHGYLRHVTDEHLNVRRKRNVRLSAQVMSSSVSSALFRLHLHNPSSSAGDLSLFVIYVNNLFQAFNGRPNPYTHRRACWKRIMPMIRTWSFWKDERKVQNHVSDDWVKNIEAIQILWAKLLVLGVPELNTRHVNLDALEILFDEIRLFGIRKTNADSHRFDTRLKASILNGSINIGNTEFSLNAAVDYLTGDLANDFAELLTDMQDFLLERLSEREDIEVETPPCNYVIDSGSKGHEEVKKCASSIHIGVKMPVGSPAFYKATLFAKQVLKKLPKVFRHCKDCLATLYDCTVHGAVNDCLCSCAQLKTSVVELLGLTKKLMFKELKVKAHYNGLTPILINSTHSLVYDGLGCNNHRTSFVTKLLNISARACIEEYVRTVNRSINSS